MVESASEPDVNDSSTKVVTAAQQKILDELMELMVDLDFPETLESYHVKLLGTPVISSPMNSRQKLNYCKQLMESIPIDTVATVKGIPLTILKDMFPYAERERKILTQFMQVITNSLDDWGKYKRLTEIANNLHGTMHYQMPDADWLAVMLGRDFERVAATTQESLRKMKSDEYWMISVILKEVLFFAAGDPSALPISAQNEMLTQFRQLVEEYKTEFPAILELNLHEELPISSLTAEEFMNTDFSVPADTLIIPELSDTKEEWNENISLSANQIVHYWKQLNNKGLVRYQKTTISPYDLANKNPYEPLPLKVAPLLYSLYEHVLETLETGEGVEAFQGMVNRTQTVADASSIHFFVEYEGEDGILSCTSESFLEKLIILERARISQLREQRGENDLLPAVRAFNVAQDFFRSIYNLLSTDYELWVKSREVSERKTILAPIKGFILGLDDAHTNFAELVEVINNPT